MKAWRFSKITFALSAFAIATASINAQSFADLAKVPGQGDWGTYKESTQVYTSDNLDQAIGSEAKRFKRFKVKQMVEAKYENQANNSKSVVQVFEFPSWKFAMAAYLRNRKVHKSTKTPKPNVSRTRGLRIITSFQGPYYIRVTTSSQEAFKPLRKLEQKVRGRCKATGKKHRVIASLKLFGNSGALAKYKIFTGGATKIAGPRVFHMDRLGSSYRARIKDLKAIITIVASKNVYKKNKSNTKHVVPKSKWKKRDKAVYKFGKKHTNRFRFYKTGNTYSIVGRYKGYILTISPIAGSGSTTSAAEMKSALEDFRIQVFFGAEAGSDDS